MTPPTPARRDAATGATTMRTQFPPIRTKPATLRITDVRQGQFRPLDDEEPDTMTEHDTTDHVAAIKQLAAEIHPLRMADGREIDVYEAVEIVKHADALAARLAAAEAKAKRWKRLAMAFRAIEKFEGVDEGKWETALGEYDAAEAVLRAHGDLTDGDDDE